MKAEKIPITLVGGVGILVGHYSTMADFYEVWLSRAAVLAKLDAMLEAREAARGQELKAATDIKRVYRGKVRALLCSA